MKPENMTPVQRGQAFEEYLQNLIDTDQLSDMMKSKEKVMEVVMKERVSPKTGIQPRSDLFFEKPDQKADYYEVKSKANLVLFDKLFVEENFAPALKKYRVLFCLMNRDVLDAEQIDEKGMGRKVLKFYKKN